MTDIVARTASDYVALITSQYSDSTKFNALVEAMVAPFCELQRLAVTLIQEYSVDAAIGDQLDVIGLWVGVNRTCIVYSLGEFFSWDTTSAEGFDAADWIGDGDNTSYSLTMDDDQYRIVINAKIYANQCGYLKSDIYAILAIMFPLDTIDVIDNLDMTMTVNYPAAMDADNKTILLSECVPLKPTGVTIEFVEV